MVIGPSAKRKGRVCETKIWLLQLPIVDVSNSLPTERQPFLLPVSQRRARMLFKREYGIAGFGDELPVTT